MINPLGDFVFYCWCESRSWSYAIPDSIFILYTWHVLIHIGLVHLQDMFSAHLRHVVGVSTCFVTNLWKMYDGM